MKKQMVIWTPSFQKQTNCLELKDEIINKGSVYHLHFMECTCMLHRQGYVSTPLLCECFKQSILYVLHSLWKDKAFPGNNLRIHFTR